MQFLDHNFASKKMLFLNVWVYFGRLDLTSYSSVLIPYAEGAPVFLSSEMIKSPFSSMYLTGMYA